ncbi:MAG: hypothetical protein AAGC93_11395, partial [Cyanobacteria bacterium P01_F01_bin.53]
AQLSKGGHNFLSYSGSNRMSGNTSPNPPERVPFKSWLEADMQTSKCALGRRNVLMAKNMSVTERSRSQSPVKAFNGVV